MSSCRSGHSSNDSVTGFTDRWEQAKRHMWGIEETAWVLSLFSLLRLKVWLRMVALTANQMMTSTAVPPWLLVLFPQFHALLLVLPPWLLKLLAGGYLLRSTLVWVQVFVREYVLHTYILAHRKKAMLPISRCKWIHWALAYPLYAPLSSLIFSTAATWAMLLHAMRHVTYDYVVAPKELGEIDADEEEEEEEGVPLLRGTQFEAAGDIR